MKRQTYQRFDATFPAVGPGARDLERAWGLEVARRSLPARRAQLYLRAAKAGQPDAMVNLGSMLKVGDGVKRNPAAARRWYAQAWRLTRDPVAAFNLAMFYDAVVGNAALRPDRRLAERWYWLAARGGIAAARRNLAFILWESHLPRKQRAGVALMLEGAASNTCTPGELYNLGLAFEFGPGVRKDLPRAMRFYRQAAELGDDDAQLALGYNLRHGIGVRRNLKEAVPWIRKAAAQDNTSARFTLGEFYRDGVGVPVNAAAAREHFRKAAKLGHEKSARALALMAAAEIEKLIASDDWASARREILRAARAPPDDHWLLSRLALTHYEQRRYSKALELDRRALSLEPRCPLALWGFAGALQMLNRMTEAEAVYRAIIRRGSSRLAIGPCGEGKRWARGLVADCWYRVGQIREGKGDRRTARVAYLKHLVLRRGAGSIYSARGVRSRLRELAANRAQSVAPA